MSDLLEKLRVALDVAALRSSVFAQNLANADTPGYKRKYVEFERLVRHQVDWQKIRPRVKTDLAPGSRADGNNVELEREAVEAAQNTLRYETLTKLAAAKLSRLLQTAREAR